MDVNKKIVVAVAFVTAVGIVQNWMQHKGITRTVLGAFVFLLVLSLLDLFGPGMSALAGALALLAALYVGLTQMPWGALFSLYGKK